MTFANNADRQGTTIDPRLDDESGTLWSETLSDVSQRLLTSAVRCIAANGFHATTTRDISGGADLSPAAMYVHFPSKEAILFEIVLTSHKRSRAALVPGDGPITSAEALSRLVAQMVEWHARHHVAARVSQYELAALTPKHYAEILEIRREINQLVRNAISAGIADASFASVDVYRVGRCIQSLAVDLVRWYRLDGEDTPEQLGAFYAEMVLKMVGFTPNLALSSPRLGGESQLIV